MFHPTWKTLLIKPNASHISLGLLDPFLKDAKDWKKKKNTFTDLPRQQKKK
jgi:hypothetical protein